MKISWLWKKAIPAVAVGAGVVLRNLVRHPVRVFREARWLERNWDKPVE